uniref:Uncharacterized protein n=1 Tax=Anguilla anguilla TaxID=7936 RepID=A0A0E9QTG4_ANGAN
MPFFRPVKSKCIWQNDTPNAFPVT